MSMAINASWPLDGKSFRSRVCVLFALYRANPRQLDTRIECTTVTIVGRLSVSLHRLEQCRLEIHCSRKHSRNQGL